MRTLFSFVAIICLSYPLIGQTRAFPDSTGLWSVVSSSGSGASISVSTTIYYSGGDSVYNSNVYQKIYRTSDTLPSGGNVYALLREDTASRRVFGMYDGDSIERLLYDFSLNVGESTTVTFLSFESGGEVNVTVVEVDSVFIDGNYRKRQRLVGDYTSRLEYWIEGIGSTDGLLNPGLSSFYITDVSLPRLLCYQERGLTLYMYESADECFIFSPSSISEVLDDKLMSVHPNPTASIVYINNIKDPAKVYVHDLLGRLILFQEGMDAPIRIDLSNFENGVYHLTIVSPSQVKTSKVMKYGS